MNQVANSQQVQSLNEHELLQKDMIASTSENIYVTQSQSQLLSSKMQLSQASQDLIKNIHNEQIEQLNQLLVTQNSRIFQLFQQLQDMQRDVFETKKAKNQDNTNFVIGITCCFAVLVLALFVI